MAIVFRFKSRRIKRAQFGPDDYCILPALAFAVALGVTNTMPSKETLEDISHLDLMAQSMVRQFLFISSVNGQFSCYLLVFLTSQ